MGNFVYIKENSGAFNKEITIALKQAFDLAPNSLTALRVKLYADIQDGYNADVRLNQVEGTLDQYEAKMVLPTHIIGQNIKMDSDFGTLDVVLIEKPSDSNSEEVNQTIYLFNNLMYELISKAQQESDKDQLKILYDKTMKIDAKLNSIYVDSIKIKDKEERKAMYEPIMNIKEKIVQLVSYLRNKLLGNQMNNDFIASLNQLAYQGVRSQAMRKKIDNRAIDNQWRFTQNKEEIENYVKKLDLTKLREIHKEKSEDIGCCFMTTNDVFESLESCDCLCLCLDVRRSEACIADPTKLIVKQIIPNFISADAFIDATKFALAGNKEAHGGFDTKSEANILVGVGRENITGALPLYLFKEHFNVAKKKIQQILGLM